MSNWSYCPRCATALEPDETACPGCGVSTPSAPTAPVELGAYQESRDDDLAALQASLKDSLSPSFILVRLLGAGGMGSVFLARDPALKRLVAVKVLAPTLAVDPGARARFEREAQAVARLSHPNVVAIHSVGQLDDGTPYFVMQHVGGQSLSARLEEEGPFSAEETGRILGEVGSALAEAHALGIIHRDIKPANVLHDDETGRVLVSDFGIAAVHPKGEQPAQTKLTMTGMALGTPQYMSPEQLLAEEVTEKADIYALGLLAYELLIGSGPFQATSPQELIAAHLRDTPKRISEVRDDIPPDLESAVAHCLEKDPEKRPTARDIAKRFTLGADRMLEWPPPGMANLHGRLPPAGNLFAVGSMLLALSFMVLLWLGPSLLSSSPMMLIIWLGGASGALTLVAAMLKLLKLGMETTIAVRGGFGWLTVVETLADRRGDSGALIAGVREYAGLRSAVRERLRRTRLVVEGALLGVALLPLLLIVPFVWLVSLGLADPAGAPLILLLPSAVLAILARVGQRREVRTVGAARARLRKHRKTREGDPGVVRSWNETLEDVRRGQHMGAGPSARPLVGRIASVGSGIALLLVLLVVTSVVIVGVLGPALSQAPRLAGTINRVRAANIMRSFTVPPDSMISPLEAGRAFYALSNIGGSSPLRIPYPQQLVPTTLEEGWFPQSFPEHLFVREAVGPGTHDARSSQEGGRPDPHKVIEYVVGGLTTEETAYLERIARNPAWEAFGTVARAPSVDYIGGQLVLPFPDSVAFWDFPTPRFFATRDAASASVSKAALLLVLGRYNQAEETLRETVSYGFALMDDGPSLIHGLIGIAVVGIGRDGLAQLYEVTGRAEAASLRARYDSVLALNEELDSPRPASVSAMTAWRQFGLSLAADTSLFRGFRIEGLAQLALAPCTNVRELLFGLSEDVKAVFMQAENELVRLESDRELFRLIRETPERGVGEGFPDNSVFKLARGIAQMSGWVLGNERLLGCTEWVTQGTRAM